MIYHIDKDRYKKLRLAVHRENHQWGAEEIHVIDGEHALCATCGVEVDSMKAETPAEFEAEKAQLA